MIDFYGFQGSLKEKNIDKDEYLEIEYGEIISRRTLFNQIRLNFPLYSQELLKDVSLILQLIQNEYNKKLIELPLKYNFHFKINEHYVFFFKN